MAQPERAFVFSRRPVSSSRKERDQLMQSLTHTRLLINQAYSGFNNASDDDLIESFVFEINALQSRYSYLLRRIKELEASV